MFPIERVAREPVIELFERHLPMDQIEIESVVLQVAAHAIFALRILHLETRVIAVVPCKRLSDLLVALDAFECWSVRAKLMATRALRRSRQGLVGFRERPGRNLRTKRSPRKEREQQDEQPTQRRPPMLGGKRTLRLRSREGQRSLQSYLKRMLYAGWVLRK